jgi:hypothetical protein
MRGRGNQVVPFPLTPRRSEGLAMKWLIGAARKSKSTAGMPAKLARELLQAAEMKGNAVARREGVHKTALANQATAHFRWRSVGSNAPGTINMDRKSFRPHGRRAIKRFQGAFVD